MDVSGPLKNARHERFAQEYLIDLNATQAYARAGYAAKGNAAETSAARLLRNVQVQARIDELKGERSERTKVDADWLLSRLAEESVADIAELYAEDGSVKPVKDWPLIWRQGLVSGVEVERIAEGIGTVTKIKISDRIKRLELIGKHIDVQAFKDKVEHSGEMSINVLPEDAGL